MARNEPIRGEITVKLSQTDRELLKTLMRGLGIDPDDEKSFADATRRLVEKPPYRGAIPPTSEDQDRVRRLLEARKEPQAEGDWLLETERAEAGDDIE